MSACPVPIFSIYIVRNLDNWASEYHYLFSTKKREIAEAWAIMEGFAAVEENYNGFNLL